MKNNVCLNNYLFLDQCTVLNVDDQNALKGVLSSESSIKSNGDDPQILLIIKFNQNVNITHVQILNGKNKEMIPSNVKLFTGRSDLDFDDVQEMKPTENFELLKNIGKPMKVNIPRFKNVNTITVRIYLFNIFFRCFFIIMMLQK